MRLKGTWSSTSTNGFKNQTGQRIEKGSSYWLYGLSRVRAVVEPVTSYIIYFRETRLATPYFEEITLWSQICKIINTRPPFSLFIYLFFLTNA